MNSSILSDLKAAPTLRFLSVGSIAIKGSLNRSDVPYSSKSITVPYLQFETSSIRFSKLPYLRIKISHKYPANPPTLNSDP